MDTDDWTVDSHTFQRLNKEMKFTIDLFATDKNAKCQRFYSNYYCKGTNGIDAFCHSWEEEVAWICPPINQICKVIGRIKKTKMSGLLFVPDWQTADYWPEIFDAQSQLRWPFIKARKSQPFLIQQEFSCKSPFKGYPKFDFYELQFVI